MCRVAFADTDTPEVGAIVLGAVTIEPLPVSITLTDATATPDRPLLSVTVHVSVVLPIGKRPVKLEVVKSVGKRPAKLEAVTLLYIAVVVVRLVPLPLTHSVTAGSRLVTMEVIVTFAPLADVALTVTDARETVGPELDAVDELPDSH